MTSSSSSSIAAASVLTWWREANGCGATERGVATVVLWAGPVDGNMGCVSYSRVDWILLMGGVGGADDRELLEASTCYMYMYMHIRIHCTVKQQYTCNMREIHLCKLYGHKSMVT